MAALETTGTDSFVASVPARSHAVDLVLTEAGFTQSLDLWTLERVPLSPTVLYRDANSSSHRDAGAVVPPRLHQPGRRLLLL